MAIHWKIDKELLKLEKIPKQTSFFYPNGVKDYFKDAFSRKKLIEKNFHTEINLNNNEKCEIYLSFNKEELKSLNSYCNTVQTPDGGTHETAMKFAIIKAIKEFGKKNQFSKINNIVSNDLFDFTDSLISIFINSPNFEGQTKKRVSMPGIQKKIRKFNIQ